MVREQVTQLATTTGVLGCCLLARDGSVLVNAMPEFLSHDEVHKAADAAVEAMLGLETLEEGAWEMDVAYTELLCVIRPVGSAILMLLCDPEANLPVLKLSMNVAAKRIASAPSHELEELRAAAPRAAAPHPVETTGEEMLPPDSVKAVIAAVRGYLAQSGGNEAVLDQILQSSGLNLEAPTRSGLRAALNEILEKIISKSMGRADATRWLNQLVKQHGLARPSA